MDKSLKEDICRRIAKIRMELAGPRGKSTFAKQLGLSASTYDYYESTRVPSVEILARMADLIGVDIDWLIRGESSKVPAVFAEHPVLLRAAALLNEHEDAVRPLAEFLNLLSERMKLPPKPAADEQTSQGRADSAEARWIPILGRTAAGVPQFWSGAEDADGITTLAELVSKHSRRQPRQVQSAVADEGETGDPVDIQIVILNAPDSDDNVVEFVSAGSFKKRYPDAFAVRVDGESMAPDICHGAVVLLSPSAGAVDGRAAVVKLAQQIGVTCKLYRRDNDMVHLIPVNEQFPTKVYPAEQIDWALRVLAKIRC